MFSGGAKVMTWEFADWRRCGSAAFVNRKVPRTLMSIIRSNFLADSCSVGSVAIALALLTTMSTPPKCSIGGVDRALYVLFVAYVADDRHALAPRGFDVCDGGVDGAGQLRVGFGRLGQQHDVCAELGGTASAIASPMPRLPPETTTVRSANVDMGLLETRGVTPYVRDATGLELAFSF